MSRNYKQVVHVKPGEPTFAMEHPSSIINLPYELARWFPPTSVEWCQVASILTRVITTHRQASWRWRHLHDTHSTSALKRKRAFKLWVLLGTEKSSYLLGTANFHQFSTYRYIIKNGRIFVEAVADLHRGKFIQWRLVGRLSDLSWCPVPDVCRCQSVAERKAGNTDEGWNMDVQTLQKSPKY